ncbi:hypothetical protein IG631_01630 [Alternaria alternata]|nr:hypothetical protein IG631_01630 [Alternaria alternata]
MRPDTRLAHLSHNRVLGRKSRARKEESAVTSQPPEERNTAPYLARCPLHYALILFELAA